MTQPRKPAGSPRSTGGQYDTTGGRNERLPVARRTEPRGVLRELTQPVAQARIHLRLFHSTSNPAAIWSLIWASWRNGSAMRARYAACSLSLLSWNSTAPLSPGWGSMT